MVTLCLFVIFLLVSYTSAKKKDPRYTVPTDSETGNAIYFPNALDAHAWCRDNIPGGGRLASFHTQKQLNKIWDTCNAAYPFGSSGSSWLCRTGWYNQAMDNVNWDWEFFPTGEPVGYTNWFAGQDNQADQFCGMVSTPVQAARGLMFSLFCSTSLNLGAVCEPDICDDFKWAKDCTSPDQCCTDECSPEGKCVGGDSDDGSHPDVIGKFAIDEESDENETNENATDESEVSDASDASAMADDNNNSHDHDMFGTKDAKPSETYTILSIILISAVFILILMLYGIYKCLVKRKSVKELNEMEMNQKKHSDVKTLYDTVIVQETS